jgi:hypothetical protein
VNIIYLIPPKTEEYIRLRAIVIAFSRKFNQLKVNKDKEKASRIGISRKTPVC